MSGWSAAVLAFAGGLTALTLVAIALAGSRLRRKPTPFLRDIGTIPVSIVQPICGLERFSQETLLSTFRLAHAEYEIVFCVASSADPIIPLVRRCMEAHPAISARLLVGDDRVSDNPKLNNCVKGWEAARNDWVILADSNVLMTPDYIARMLAAWRPDSGLVCSTPAGTRPDGFWAEVECAFLNTLQARWQYVGEAVGLGFAQGKSMLWFRPFLEREGGIRALAREIAEDAAATKIVRAAGLHVHLVDQPFEQPLGHRRGRDVWSRQLRWARLRRVTFPAFFTPEILSTPVVPALAAALAGGPLGIGLAGALIVAWYGAEIALARRIGWFVSWRSPVTFLARDLAIPALWACAFATRTIVWRGNAMDIRTKADAALATGSWRA